MDDSSARPGQVADSDQAVKTGPLFLLYGDVVCPHCRSSYPLEHLLFRGDVVFRPVYHNPRERSLMLQRAQARGVAVITQVRETLLRQEQGVSITVENVPYARSLDQVPEACACDCGDVRCNCRV